MNKGKSIWGIILIVVGAMLIMDKLNVFRVNWFAAITVPGILMILAFVFFAGYLSKGPDSAGLLVPAGILSACGVVMFLGMTFGLWSYVWPGFIAAPAFGLLLLYLFGHARTPGLLVPIGILMTVSITCFFSMTLHLWSVLWPGFVLAPAVGLGMMYMADRRDSKLLIPVFILGGLSGLFFLGMTAMTTVASSKYSLAGILILIGIVMMFKKPNGHKRHRRGHGQYGPNPYDNSWQGQYTSYDAYNPNANNGAAGQGPQDVGKYNGGAPDKQ